MLTKRQKEVFDFIKAYSDKHGYSPSIPETAKHFKLAISTVHEHLQRLQDKGQLQKQKNQRRGTELRETERMVQVPLLGIISAGQPIESMQQMELIAVPQSKFPSSGKVFALKVAGDSMIDENIHDGDIILVKQQDVAENGEKVVALVNNYETTIKTYYQERGQIRLQPANKKMEPIIVRKDMDFRIQGIFVDVIENEQELNTYDVLTPKVIRKEEKRRRPYYEKPGFKLYYANCLDILAEIPANSVDMIFADPPYNLSNGGFSVHAGRRVSVNKGDWDKSRGFNDDYNFHYKWIEACRRVLKSNGTLWVSGTYHSIFQCGHALQALGFHILNDVAWFKPNASPNLSCRYFTASHETLIWARKDKKSKHTFNYKAMKDGYWPEDNLKKPGFQMRSVWSIGTPKPNEKRFGKHPTQKPEDLLKRIVLASTNRGDLIVDPFTGSSTTGIAAYLNGRRFIGIDSEPKYLDLSIKRFEGLGNSK